MKQGTKQCNVCRLFMPETKTYLVREYKFVVCHVCWVHLMSALYNNYVIA